MQDPSAPGPKLVPGPSGPGPKLVPGPSAPGPKLDPCRPKWNLGPSGTRAQAGPGSKLITNDSGYFVIQFLGQGDSQMELDLEWIYPPCDYMPFPDNKGEGSDRATLPGHNN